MKASDFDNLIPQSVKDACLAYETNEDGDARASLEFPMSGGRVFLHIHTENSHWEAPMDVQEYLNDPVAAWSRAIAWLG